MHHKVKIFWNFDFILDYEICILFFKVYGVSLLLKNILIDITFSLSIWKL